MHREQPTVDTVFDCVPVPSPEGGVADCETSPDGGGGAPGGPDGEDGSTCVIMSCCVESA